MNGKDVTLFCTILKRDYVIIFQMSHNFETWKRIVLFQIYLWNLQNNDRKLECHTFWNKPRFGSRRHVTHNKKLIIAFRSNHLFCLKTRLVFRWFWIKFSRVVSASNSRLSKTPLLSGRGTPPPFWKKYEIPSITVSHGVRPSISLYEFNENCSKWRFFGAF